MAAWAIRSLRFYGLFFFFFALTWCHYQKSSNIESLAVPTATQFCWGRWCHKGKGICADRQMVMVSRTSLGLCANDRLTDLHVQPRVFVKLTVNRLLCVSAPLPCYNKPLGSEKTVDREGYRKRGKIVSCELPLGFSPWYSRSSSGF